MTACTECWDDSAVSSSFSHSLQLSLLLPWRKTRTNNLKRVCQVATSFVYAVTSECKYTCRYLYYACFMFPWKPKFESDPGPNQLEET